LADEEPDCASIRSPLDECFGAISSANGLDHNQQGLSGRRRLIFQQFNTVFWAFFLSSGWIAMEALQEVSCR